MDKLLIIAIYPLATMFSKLSATDMVIIQDKIDIITEELMET